MARYPGAIWKPIESKFLPNRRMAAFNRVNLHVAASEASSLHGYFNAKGRASSHFYVRKNGVVEQYVDTAYQAEADLDGNDATISIETQGGVSRPNSEPWTAAQIEALARIYAWAVRTHNIPARMAKDSRIGPTSHGLSWHRLGIDGNFPGGLLAGRVSGGMRYSKWGGKICPGDAKIKQIPTIYARAVEILGGQSGTEDDMPTPEELWKHIIPGTDEYAQTHLRRSTYAYNHILELRATMSNLVGAVAALGRGEDLDVEKLKAGVEKAARDGVTKGVAEIRAAVTDALAGFEGVDAERVADLVLDGLGARLSEK